MQKLVYRNIVGLVIKNELEYFGFRKRFVKAKVLKIKTQKITANIYMLTGTYR